MRRGTGAAGPGAAGADAVTVADRRPPTAVSALPLTAARPLQCPSGTGSSTSTGISRDVFCWYSAYGG